MRPGNAPIHYLSQNHDTWTPAALIVIDSETRTVGDGPDESEQLRCWSARLVRRRHRRRAGETQRQHGDQAADVAELIDYWATSDKSTWLFAHNVTFDLVTTRLAENLARLGWELSSRHAVSGSAPWIVLHKGFREDKPRRGTEHADSGDRRGKWQHTLTITDSFSVMPVKLELISQYAPVAKPLLPRDDAPMADWYARCDADVEILTWALLTMLDWWDDHDLGKWSVSGAASGWNTYRHKIGPKDVTIDTEETATAWEHNALYGGRRDIFRCGNLPRGRYSEADFEAAYPTIAATQLLPARRLGTLNRPMAQAIIEGRCKYGMIAEVSVSTDQPRYPLRTKGRVFYPVGTFTTVMAGPEIIAAHRRGDITAIGTGYFYSLSDHMQPWAKWVLSVQRSPEDQVPGPVRIAAKSWSRSVCGKWAQRGWSTQEFPGPPSDSWSYEDTWIAGSNVAATICGLAGKYYLSMADQPSDHEFPAVLAYIESHCRLRLNAVIDAAPPEAIIQCDTDGMMISVQALEDHLGDMLAYGDMIDSRKKRIDLALAHFSDLAAPLEMREKTSFNSAVVYGPQHVTIDGKPRFSGVPRNAWQAGDNKWAARLWPSLSWQIQHGGQDGYVRPAQEYLIVGPYAAGWVTDTGIVRPAEAELDAQGHTHLTPWPQTRWAASGDRLAATQAGWTSGLLGQPAIAGEQRG